MYEVYWADYEDRSEEPEAVFDTWDEAVEYVEIHGDDCGMDEWYEIHDVKADWWYS